MHVIFASGSCSSYVYLNAFYIKYNSQCLICFSISLSCFPQDENSSVCTPKVDILQKMLSKEQQELQVSITVTVTYFHTALLLWCTSCTSKATLQCFFVSKCPESESITSSNRKLCLCRRQIKCVQLIKLFHAVIISFFLSLFFKPPYASDQSM